MPDVNISIFGEALGSTTMGGVPVTLLPQDGTCQLTPKAFLTTRSDHLGMTLVQKMALLEVLLPQQQTLYLGLFAHVPNRLGHGGEELAVPGYERLQILRWTTAVTGSSAKRSNATVLRMPMLRGPTSFEGWGVWNAPTGGELKAFGFTRTEAGSPVGLAMGAGDRPMFGPGDVGVAIA